MSNKTIDAERVNGQLDDSELEQVAGGQKSTMDKFLLAVREASGAVMGLISNGGGPDNKNDGNAVTGTRA